MKITKYVHSCLLVEMPEPINRTALFDPGDFSVGALDIDALKFLDDIIITHGHSDHFNLSFIQKLVAKFPSVHITAPPEVVESLAAANIEASSQASDGIVFFDSPHEVIKPFYAYDPPQEIGVHYLDTLSHPGDSHNFHQTMPILALPVQAPWGSTNNAVKLGLTLKPKYILPIHDWHWSEEARAASYSLMEQVFAGEGIVFLKLQTGVPVVLTL
jgi:L-ascorbate metabolism protein UlaG (beta-lactamase superfamily)